MSGRLEKFTLGASVGLFLMQRLQKCTKKGHKSDPESRRAMVQSVMITLRIYRANTQMALHFAADLWPTA